MTITVDRDALGARRETSIRYQQLEGITLWVELEGIDREARADLVRSALAEQVQAGAVYVVPTEHGTWVWAPLGHVNDIVDALIAELEPSGVNGAISPAPAPPQIAVPHRRGPALFMAHHIDPPPAWSTFNAFGAPAPRWDVPAAAQARLFDDIAAWLISDPVAYADIFNCLPFTAAGAPAVLEHLITERRKFQVVSLAGRPSDDLSVGREDPVLRVVQFASFGVTVWTDLRGDLTPVDRALGLELQLRALAPDLEAGFLSTVIPQGNERADLTKTIWRQRRHLWGWWVGDAHGVQLLNSSHLDRAHNLDNWHLDEVAADRWLLKAPDLTPWLEDPVPEEVLQQARHDFGDMILTREVAADNPPEKFR